jgi:hypothetical protein
MSSRQASVGYQETIRGLLAGLLTRSPRVADGSEHPDPLAFSPDEATVADTGKADPGVSYPGRGIVISVILGLALWGIIIVVLVAVTR